MLPEGRFIPGKPGIPEDTGNGLAHRGLGDQEGIKGDHHRGHLLDQTPQRLQDKTVIILPVGLKPGLAVMEAVFHQEREKCRGNGHGIQLLFPAHHSIKHRYLQPDPIFFLLLSSFPLLLARFYGTIAA